MTRVPYFLAVSQQNTPAQSAKADTEWHIYIIRKALVKPNDADVQFCVHFGTLCLCSTLLWWPKKIAYTQQHGVGQTCETQLTTDLVYQVQ